MPVFFISPECITPPIISITGDLLTHLRDSLRTTVGKIVWFGDGAGHRYCTEITALTERTMIGRIIEVLTQPFQRTPTVILGQALLKGEKMDWLIQKAVELGVQTIVPLQTRHSVIRIKTNRIATQLARWQRIALEAAQQSEQWNVATIAQPQSLREFCVFPDVGPTRLFLAERRNGTSLREIALPSGNEDTIVLLVGPEGGWSKEEVLLAERTGCTSVTLGPRILRAETAALAAISILQLRLGNLE